MDSLDKIQEFLATQEWYDELLMGEKLDVVEALDNFTQKEKELSRKLYYACHHAFLWHCGSGSEKSEKDCMEVLEKAIEEYKKEQI